MKPSNKIKGDEFDDIFDITHGNFINSMDQKTKHELYSQTLQTIVNRRMIKESGTTTKSIGI